MTDAEKIADWRRDVGRSRALAVEEGGHKEGGWLWCSANPRGWGVRVGGLGLNNGSIWSGSYKWAVYRPGGPKVPKRPPRWPTFRPRARCLVPWLSRSICPLRAAPRCPPWQLWYLLFWISTKIHAFHLGYPTLLIHCLPKWIQVYSGLLYSTKLEEVNLNPQPKVLGELLIPCMWGDSILSSWRGTFSYKSINTLELLYSYVYHMHTHAILLLQNVYTQSHILC